jgi:ABC-type multidrug transport system fused ATPase/permease subunit
MFVLLFCVSLVLAFAISASIAWVSSGPIDSILHHFFPDHIRVAASKYLRFAITLVGTCSGTRVGILQDYLAAPAWNREAMKATLTQEFWALELYRTALSSLIGIAWLLLGVSLFAIVAIYLYRKSRGKQPHIHQAPTKLPDSEKPVRTMR